MKLTEKVIARLELPAGVSERLFSDDDLTGLSLRLRRTAKERLGVKASDEQRVDNCKVPLDRRGPKPRGDECGDSASTRNHK